MFAILIQETILADMGVRRKSMESYLAYFDETGDDGLINTSTDHFVLTSIYMPADRWQSNFNKLRDMRIDLR